MQWRIDSNRPVYLQIMEHIHSRVLSGEYSPGDRIPSVRELAAAASVNPNTVQRAMMELEHKGLLVSIGTLGKFITEDRQILDTLRQQAIQEAIRSSAARFRDLGLSMQEATQLLLQQEEV